MNRYATHEILQVSVDLFRLSRLLRLFSFLRSVLRDLFAFLWFLTTPFTLVIAISRGQKDVFKWNLELSFVRSVLLYDFKNVKVRDSIVMVYD